MDKLRPSSHFTGPRGPVVLLIMDGIGIGLKDEGDLVHTASTPNLDRLRNTVLVSELKAHGVAVGMPSDEDMGNSEVGHNAIGSGRVFTQGASLIRQAIASRSLFEGSTWNRLIGQTLEQSSTLHFIGLLSDGNVHSHIDHLEAMLSEAKSRGVRTVRLHILLDGRDVPPTSALEYVDRLEAFLKGLNAAGEGSYAIASGGGRMKVAMDRYEADWRIVERGWKTHVCGEGPLYPCARTAIEALRAASPGILDQDLPPFVIGLNGRPIGPVQDGDGVILFNFRGDRAMQISRAFEEDDFDKFDRGRRPKVVFAGMMQYDGDRMIPKQFLVPPPAINRTMGEYLARAKVSQLAISETQKFGHVTYFFNGNRTGEFDAETETYIEIPSDRVPFEQRPWMKAAEITDRVIEEIHSGQHRFIRINLANGDMVGHTGIFLAVQIAVETVDLCVGRILQAVTAAGGILIISADHGNAEDMAERDKKTGTIVRDSSTGCPKPKTAHSLNSVPVYIVAPENQGQLKLSPFRGLGISSLAATCLCLLGFEPPEDYTPSIVDVE